jgi:hypothetical protein
MCLILSDAAHYCLELPTHWLLPPTLTITANTTTVLQGPKLEKAIQIPHPTAGVPPVTVPDPQVAPRLHPMPSESVLAIHNVSITAASSYCCLS